MRWFLMTIWTAGCLALASNGLYAQDKGEKGKGEPVPAPKGLVDPGCPPACAPECCPSTYKTCVPVPDVHKKTKTVFCCREIDFCLPKCSSCSLFSRHHCTEPCPNCENCARTKRVLLTKVVTEECPSTKCVVEERVRESCPTGHHSVLPWARGGHGAASGGTMVLPSDPAPVVIPPAPLPKGK